MGPSHVRRIYVLDETGQSLLRAASERLGLTARAYHRLLKVARTIADQLRGNYPILQLIDGKFCDRRVSRAPGQPPAQRDRHLQ